METLSDASELSREELLDRWQKAEQRLKEAQTRAQETMREIWQIDVQLQNEEERAQKAEGRLKELEASLGDATRAPADSQAIEEAEERASEAQERLHELQTQLDEAPTQDELDEAQERIRELQALLDEASEAKADAEALREAEDKAWQATQRAEELEARLDEAPREEELEQARERIRELEAQLEEAPDTEVDEEALREAEERARQAEQRVAELQTRLDDAPEPVELEQAQERIRELEAQLEEAPDTEVDEEALREAEERARQAEQRVVDLEGQLEQVDPEALTEAEERAREAEDRVEELEAQLLELPTIDELEQAQKRVRELEEQVEEGGDVLDLDDGALQEAQERIKELEALLENAGAAQDDAVATEALDRAEKAEARAWLAEEKLREYEEAGPGTEADPEAEQKLREAQDKLEDAERKIETLQAKLDRLAESGSGDDLLKERYQQTKEKLEFTNEKLELVEERLAGYKDKAETAGERIELAERKAKELEERLRAAEQRGVKTGEELVSAEEKLRRAELKVMEANERKRESDLRCSQAEITLKKAEDRLGDYEQKAQESDRETQRLAFQDSLTGLPNLNLIKQYLDFTVKQVVRYGRPAALLVLDLDRFKVINDAMGFKAGDELLVRVSERLQAAIRESDALGRRGEDEFLILLSELNLGGDAGGGPASHQIEYVRRNVEMVVARVVESLSRPFTVQGQKFYIRASLGISLCPGDAETAQHMLEHADSAMYHAKETGRNRYQFYTTDLHQKQERRLTLDVQLRHALEKGEFQLYYQPIVQFQKGGKARMIGAEALIRWIHRIEGVLEPDYFLPIAEETGLIVPIGQWVVQEACWQLHQWLTEGLSIFCSINLSPRQLLQADLAESIIRTMTDSNIPPEALFVEIQEDVNVLNPDLMDNVVEELGGAGIRIAIDDFGTGFSSLTRFNLAHTRILKIDPSIVADCAHATQSANVCSAAINLAKSLGLLPLAEGVESAAQAKFLQKAGCELAQGFLFSPPVPAAQLAKIYVESREWRF